MIESTNGRFEMWEFVFNKLELFKSNQHLLLSRKYYSFSNLSFWNNSSYIIFSSIFLSFKFNNKTQYKLI